jgi:hypothetical protein
MRGWVNILTILLKVLRVVRVWTSITLKPFIIDFYPLPANSISQYVGRSVCLSVVRSPEKNISQPNLDFGWFDCVARGISGVGGGGGGVGGGLKI